MENMLYVFQSNIFSNFSHALRYVLCICRSEEVIILGELNKWVVMSPQRITSITLSTDDIQMSLTGAINEQVNMSFQVSGKMTSILCVMGKSGTSSLSLKDHQCVST